MMKRFAVTFSALVLLSTPGIFGAPPGEWMLREPLAVADRLNDIVFEQGKFVAVGPSGSVYHSADGKVWAGRNAGTSANLSAVCYANGMFVAAGAEGTILTSPDGISWTVRHWTGAHALWDVASGDGVFVAVGDNATILSSADGIAWTTRMPSATAGTLRSICFGAGQFVIGGGNSILTSTDATTWTTALSLPYEPSRVAYGNGRFVVTCQGWGLASQNRTLSSTDGRTWSDVPPLGMVDGLEFVNGRFIACAVDPGWPLPTGSRILMSTEGSSWATAYSTGEITWGTGVAYGNGTYVVVRNVGLLTSADGQSWADLRSPGWPAGAVHFVNGSFLVSQAETDPTAVPYSGARLLRSVLGDLWTAHRQPNAFTLGGVAFGAGVYVAPAINSMLASTDGINWTGYSAPAGAYHGMAFDGERFVAFGGAGFVLTTNQWVEMHWYDGPVISTSRDGTHWTRIEEPVGLPDPGAVYGSITFGNNRFVAYGSTARAGMFVATSKDAYTWETTEFPGLVDYRSRLVAGNGRFIVMGGDRQTLITYTSDDGVNWTRQRDQRSGFIPGGGAYGNGWFVMAGSFESGWFEPIGALLTSADGISWTSTLLPTTRAFSGIAYGNGRFVVGHHPIFQSALVEPPFEVTLAASSAAVAPFDPGTLTLYRRGTAGIGIDLAVDLSFNGTAQPGIDLEPIPATIVIPAGRKSITIPIIARKTGSTFSTNSLRINLMPGEAYNAGQASSASAVVENPGSIPRFRRSGITRQADGSTELIIDSPEGSVIEVDVSSDLREWARLTTLTSSSGSVRLIDPAASQSPRRFYRATVGE